MKMNMKNRMKKYTKSNDNVTSTNQHSSIQFNKI